MLCLPDCTAISHFNYLIYFPIADKNPKEYFLRACYALAYAPTTDKC